MGLRLGLHVAVHEACLGVGTGEIKWAGSSNGTITVLVINLLQI